tara:strand:- start:558 stop:953 length:396 start_codon:yes stop_codon:yes gene_type:complete
MYAVFENGGKQYKVNKDDVIKLEKFESKKDDIIKIDNILICGDDQGNTTVGDPYVEDASVSLKVIDTIKEKKVLIFKKKRRHNYRRKLGHRQNLVLLRVMNIILDKIKNNDPENKNASNITKKKEAIKSKD